MPHQHPKQPCAWHCRDSLSRLGRVCPCRLIQVKANLARNSGLSLKQLEDFFRNYRRRHWQRDMRVHGGSASKHQVKA